LINLFRLYYSLRVKQGLQDPGHGFEHIRFVAETAKTIANILKNKGQLSIKEVRMAFIAGLLHDFVRPSSGKGHSLKSAIASEGLLDGISEEDRKRIIDAIKRHSIEYLYAEFKFGSIDGFTLEEYLEKAKHISGRGMANESFISSIKSEDDIEFAVRCADFLDRLEFTEIYRRNLHIYAQKSRRNKKGFLNYWKYRIERDKRILISDEGQRLFSILPEQYKRRLIKEFSAIEEYYIRLSNNPEFFKEEFKKLKYAFNKNLTPQEYLKGIRDYYRNNPNYYANFGISPETVMLWLYGSIEADKMGSELILHKTEVPSISVKKKPSIKLLDREILRTAIGRGKSLFLVEKI